MTSLPSPTPPHADGRVGIIDIGSNSIRFVVYDQLKRAPVALYNEKVLCQLGKGLSTTRKLNPEGVELAREALRRFLTLSRNMEVTSLHVMATAAVRDAEDGTQFARELEKHYGVEIDIISGEREARLGAYGIGASTHEPHGITGDLGGGSMELVYLRGSELKEQTTLPIGALRLIDEHRGNRASARKAIEKAFEGAAWLKQTGAPRFYAIGGSFRAIAKLHMDASEYPLHILHQYRVAAKDFLSFARELAAMPEEKLEKLPGLPGKRVPSIPPAAMILEHVLETMGAEEIAFSASGIREGYLHEMLSPYLRAQDMLLSSCMEWAGKGSRTAVPYAQELMQWTQTLFKKESENGLRLRMAFCLLADIAHHIHPEYRAEWAMQRILQSSLTGLSHEERVALALALYHRYQFRMKDEPRALALIGREAKEWARLLGSAANLAYHLSGGIPGTLPQTGLLQEKKKLALQLVEPMGALQGEAVRKRLENLNAAFVGEG